MSIVHSSATLSPGGEHVDALRIENERLKKELEELRQLKAASAAKTDAISAEKTGRLALQPRGYGQRFSIRGWTGDRNEQLENGSTSGASALRLQVSEPKAQDFDKSDKASSSGAKPQKLRPTAPAWLGSRPFLSTSEASSNHAGIARLDGDAEIHNFLMEAGHLLNSNRRNINEAFSSFGKAFCLHLSQQNRTHLEFSASLPRFFVKLRENDVEVSSVLSKCAAMIRRLQAVAQFGDSPPSTRPEGMDRWQFVRELCSQVGLSLDLARIACAQRRARYYHSRSKVEPSTPRIDGSRSPATPMSDSGFSAAGFDSRSEKLDPESRFWEPVSTSESQDAITRAGRYLRAVQLDLERFRGEAERLAKEAEAALRKSTTVAPSSHVEKVEPLPIEDAKEAAGGISEAADVCEALAETTAEVPVAKQPVQEELKLPPGISKEGCIDELLIPTFGQFIERQLLPLYVGDIQFSVLRELLDYWCGQSLDSDDEHNAWKVFGRSPPVQQAKVTSRTARKDGPTLSQDADGEGSLPPTPSSQGSSLRLEANTSDAGRLEDGASLGHLLQAAEVKTSLRAQMVNSVIEKRRVGKPAHPDVLAPKLPRSDVSRLAPSNASKASGSASKSMAPPSMPNARTKILSTPRVSKALLMSPATETVVKKKRRGILLSPVQWRHQELLQTRDVATEVAPIPSSFARADFCVFEEETPYKKKKTHEFDEG